MTIQVNHSRISSFRFLSFKRFACGLPIADDDCIGVRYELKTEKTTGTGVLTAEVAKFLRMDGGESSSSEYIVKVTPEDNPLHRQRFPSASP